MAGRRRPQKQTIIIRKELIFPYDEGEFTVAQGIHEITIKTYDKKFKKNQIPSGPVDVWVSLEDNGLQVCGGSVSKAGVSLMSDGFVIYLDTCSTECLVKWYAEL